VMILALRLGGGDSEQAERMRRPLEAEMKTLEAAGARVQLVTPDDASQSAFGLNLMDARVRPAAAKAGLAQGRAMAGGLKAFWE